MGANVSNQHRQLSGISLTVIRYLLLATTLQCLGSVSAAQRLNDPQRYPSPEVDSASRVREIPAGRIDGWNVTFFVEHTPADYGAHSFQLYRNGVRLINGIDFHIQGERIIMSEQQVPQPGDELIALYSLDRSQILPTSNRGLGKARQYGNEISLAATRMALENEVRLNRIGTRVPVSESNASSLIRRDPTSAPIRSQDVEADGVDGLGDQSNNFDEVNTLEGRVRSQLGNSKKYPSLEMLQRSLYERGYDAALMEGDPQPMQSPWPSRSAIQPRRLEKSALSRLAARSLEESWRN